MREALSDCTRSASLVQNTAVAGNGDDSPRNKFSARFKRVYRSVFDAAAAGYFHADDGEAFDIVFADNRSKLFRVVAFVEFRTADERRFAFDKIVVKISVCVSGTVRRDQKMRAVEIRSAERGEFDLYRPLPKLR